MIQRDGDCRILIGLVLLVAFSLRLGAAYWWENRLTEGQQFAWGDSAGYWALAGQTREANPIAMALGTRASFVLLVTRFCWLGSIELRAKSRQ